jgi:hypothetical protein
MSPAISIPKGWQCPRFTFGQRTERGLVIGMKYYSEDTFMADEYGEGWRYILLPNKNTEYEEHRIENELELLTPQELKTQIETEINSHLRQIELLKHECKAISVDVITVNSTVKTEPVSQIQEQISISLPDLHTFVDAAKFILKEIAKHPDYLALDYQSDLTISDAETALSYLQSELESNQKLDTTSDIYPQH